MRKTGIGPKAHVLSLAVLLAGGLVGSALAESPCKGLEQRQCEGKAGCIWIDGYVRKDGAKVAGYCKKGGQSSGTSSTEEKKVASKDKDKKSSAKE